MTLRPQPLAIQFGGGLDTKDDSKQVPTTKLINLENAVFSKQTTLSKRNGYEALSRLVDGTDSEYGDPVGLASRADELLLFTSERCYSYRPSVDRWADAGECASTTGTESPIGRTGTNQTMPDHATLSGVTVVAWEDSRGGVYCSVVESESGRILLAETVLHATAISPRCVACGTVLHVYFVVAASGEIRVAIVNPASPADAPAVSVLTSDLSLTNYVYDATDALPYYTSIGPAIMAWAITGGGYRVGYVHPSGVLGAPVNGLPTVATWADAITGPIAVAPDRVDSADIAVAWCSTVPNVRWLSSSSLTTSTGTVAASATTGTWNRVTLEQTGDGQAWWGAELDAARDDLNLIECGLVDSTPVVVTASTDRQLHGHGLVSRAFYDDGNVYVAVGHEVAYFPYIAIVRISGDDFGGDAVTSCYGRLVVGQFPGLPARAHLTSAQAIDPDSLGVSRVHAVCAGYRIQLDSENGDQFSEVGIKIARLDFDADTAYQSAELGRGLYLASAGPLHYDGRRWAESGFHTAPDAVTGVAFVASGAAGAMAAGTYEYKLVYEEIDAQGEIHQSAPSVAQNVTIGAATKVNVTAPTYRLTGKRRVRIGVFRSPVDQTGEPADIPFYRVTSTDPNDSGDNGFLVNDPTADAVSFTDNLTDAVLVTREPLYTNGGILANAPAPMAGNIIAGGKSRLYWNDLTDPHLVRYSQELAEETALEAPVYLSQTCDPYGGDIVGISVMDGAIFAFAETAIYGFAGPGPLPDPNAGNESFSPSELITSDVGCKAPNSICQTPNGIVFQSEKGIKLLDRSRQVQDIGRDVYGFNDQTITRATLLPDRHAVIFLTDAGYTLLWDYERSQWSKFTNHEGYDARVIDGVYHYLRTDGRVFAETVDAYRDDNAQITMRIETAEIHFVPYLQGWQRVLWAYFLGKWLSDHTLVVRYRTNYDAGYSAPLELDVNTNYDPDLYGAGAYGSGAYGGLGGDTTRYQRRLHLNKECQSISFRIEDAQETEDAGASFELSELLLIGGVLDIGYKTGAARTN